MSKMQGQSEQEYLVCRESSSLQFDQILAAYKAHSRHWKPIINKFAEGEAFKNQFSIRSYVCSSLTTCNSIYVLSIFQYYSNGKLCCSSHAWQEASNGWIKLVPHLENTASLWSLRCSYLTCGIILTCCKPHQCIGFASLK